MKDTREKERRRKKEERNKMRIIANINDKSQVTSTTVFSNQGEQRMDSGKQTDSVGDGSRENNVEKYIQTLYRAMKLCRPSSEELLYLSS